MASYIETITPTICTEATPPDGYVREVTGSTPDINKGFGGRFVYLVPKFTHNKNKAATRISIAISESAVEGYADLAAGAGGNFRYIVVSNEPEARKKIDKVALVRKGKDAGPVTIDEADALGFDRVTGDINEGRGGEYLHIVYGLKD